MKQKDGWRNESQFRKDFMKSFRNNGYKVYRIEYGPGGTDGLPDLILKNRERCLIYIELKCLNPNREFTPISKEHERCLKLAKIVSPAQKRVLKELAECTPTYVAAAHKGTRQFSLIKVLSLQDDAVGALLFDDDGDARYGSNFKGTRQMFDRISMYESLKALARMHGGTVIEGPE